MVIEDDDRDEPIEEVEDPTACPECGAPDIYRTSRLPMFFAIAVVVMGVGIAVGLSDAAFLAVLALAVFFLIAGRWRCSECGENWN